MAKIFFFNVPAHGHINPTLPIVEMLLAEGHEVVYYNFEAFRAKVSATGALFRAYPLAFGPSTHDLRCLPKMYYHIWACCDALLEWLLEEVRLHRPDCIVHDSLCTWGKLAARLAKVPAVSLHTFFVFSNRGIVFALLHNPSILLKCANWLGIKNLRFWWEARKLKRALLERWGINRAEFAGMFSNTQPTNIVFTSRLIHPDTFDQRGPDRYHFVGACVSAHKQLGLDFALDEASGWPLVYVSLGTSQSNNRIEPFKRVLSAFSGQPFRVVVSLGGRLSRGGLGAVPTNVTVREFVPQVEILAKADLFITHAGMNGVHESLLCGVPMIAVPLQGEQFVNAQRVVELGCGLIFDIDGMPPALLLEKAKLIMASGGFKERARLVGGALRRSGGARKAVAVILETAASRRQVGALRENALLKSS
jgi:MGT family glycosyltransferase